jgi:hypothetical protein
MKKKQYRFMGTDPRFQPGEEYTLYDICDHTGLTRSAVRMRLMGLDSFEDRHLLKLHERYSRIMPKRTLAEQEHAKKVKADIIKHCVISETQYLVLGHPVAEIQVANWLDSVMNNSRDFWLKMDKLTVSEIITLAVQAEPVDHLWQRRQLEVEALA